MNPRPPPPLSLQRLWTLIHLRIQRRLLALPAPVRGMLWMALGGLLVFAVALPQGDATGPIDGEAARRLGLVVGLLLPLLYVLPIMLVSRYGLTRARHDEVRQALGRR